jgi:serine/threonine protein kinase
MGQTSTSSTFEAESLRTGQRVVIKRLALSEVDDPRERELLLRRAEMLARLEHPGVPRIFEHFAIETAAGPCMLLVMELLSGGSLQEHIENGWLPDRAEIASRRKLKKKTKNDE